MVSDSGMTRTFLAVFLSLLYAVPVHGRQAPPRAWVIATYAYPQRDRVAAIQPLADYLGVRARHPVQVRLFDSPTALVDALRRGEVDVAVPNLHGYLQARRASEPLTTLPVPQYRHCRRTVTAPYWSADRGWKRRANWNGRRGHCVWSWSVAIRPRAASCRCVNCAAGAWNRRPPSPISLTPVRMRRPWRPWRAVAPTWPRWRPMSTTPRDRPAWWKYGARSRSRPGPLLCRPAADVPCQQFTAWLLEAHDEAPAVMAALRAGWPEFGDATVFVPARTALLTPALLD